MTRHRLGRRAALLAAGGLAASGFARPALARGSVTAAIYPGAWDEAFRTHVAPALKRTHNVDLAMEPLFAVDQINKVQAARGAPPFDVFVLDPGPRITAIERGLFEPFDLRRLPNGGQIPERMSDQWGIGVNVQVVGIAYNPRRLPAPKGWADLFREPFVSRLGITGFQTTFGTVSLIEIAKVFGGSETDVEPAFAELRKALPRIAAVGGPAAMPGLFQQGQCDVMYTNTQNVATLKERGVDIAFAVPETGAITFVTSMHLVKGTRETANAYRYIDTVVSAGVQEALSKPPFNFIPVNRSVPLGADLPMRSLDEMANFVTHDWTRINPLRAEWIQRFNREMAR
jgi:putative spermidine/putrescine transport system substrate-binding protein